MRSMLRLKTQTPPLLPLLLPHLGVLGVLGRPLKAYLGGDCLVAAFWGQKPRFLALLGSQNDPQMGSKGTNLQAQ